MNWRGWLRRPKTKLREGVFSGSFDSADPDVNLSAAQGGSPFFRRLTQGQRDLTSLTQDRARELGFWLYETNPLAKRILELTRDYVVGEGISVTAQHVDEAQSQAIQGVIDAFWNDAVNCMDLKLHDKVLELGLWGEACYTATVNPISGAVRLGYVDPGNIAHILHDPRNSEQATDVVLTSIGEPQRLRVIRVDENPQSRTYGRLIGVETDGQGNILTSYQETDREGNAVGTARPYLGACFLFRINKVSNAQRGRSDLLSLLDWIDAYDQILFGEIDRALLLKSFVWDVTLTGADQATIDAYIAKNKAPKPGSLRAHNEKVVWQAVTPDLKSVDAQENADLLLSYISTGAGHPKTWLSGTMDVNKATAQELANPAIKRITARQRYVRYMLTQMLTFVLDQAELHGRLKRGRLAGTTSPEPWSFSVNAPDPLPRDTAGAAATLFQVAQALAVARAEGAIDVEVEQEVFALLIAQLGVSYDVQTLRDRLAKAEEDTATETGDVVVHAVAEALAAGRNGHAD